MNALDHWSFDYFKKYTIHSVHIFQEDATDGVKSRLVKTPITHVDKASKFLVAGLAKNKTAKNMNKITSKLFENIPQEKIKTFTCDNGKEFSYHEELSETLSASFYFANPYHSWERGLNEHTNGLLRQFFPKGTNFKIVSPEEVEKAVELINNRPRKCLDYRTPFEVFYELTSDSDALHC